MKISSQTISLLKNFASINPSIAVKAGSALKTISPQNNIMAEALVSETFPPFAIYELNMFLGAISLFETPEFEFDTDFVKIKEGNRSIKYYFADSSMVKAAGDKKIVLPSVDVSFEFKEAQLSEILKASSVLNVPEIMICSDGASKTRVVTADSKNKGSNDFSIEVDHESDAKFKIVFKSENLKMINGDYKVDVCARGISKFTNSKLGVEYYIASEASSEFAK